MWIKMDQVQIDEMLDGLISKYKSTQKGRFIGGSIVMLGLAVIINFVVFPAATPFLSGQFPTEIEVLIRIVVVFFVLEIFISVIMAIDNHRFYKMNVYEKREYLFQNISKGNTKICPRCGLLYQNDEVRCSKCNDILDIASNYNWVDDIQSEDSKSSTRQ